MRLSEEETALLQRRLSDLRTDELVRLLDETSARADQLSREATDLQAERDQLESGSSSRQAALDAANFYERLGAKDERKAMLEIAAREGSGPIQYGAEVSLALGEIDTGNADAGIARLKKLTSQDGFLAEDASYILARTLDDAGKKDEARTAYAAFLEKWPESARAYKVKMFQTKLDEVKPAAAPEGVVPEIGRAHV